MKPFDLEEAKAGKPICTRDGRKARIICFDKKRYNQEDIIALVTEKDGTETDFSYNQDGKNPFAGSHIDLMMAGEKKEGYVNLYRCHNSIITSNVYKTMNEALLNTKVDNFISTTKIEWEE